MRNLPHFTTENSMHMRKLVVILGVPIDVVNMAETLSRLEQFVLDGRDSGRSYQVTTINTDFIVKALRDPELRYLLQDADLAIPDGMPLVWGARMLGVSLVERVAGADLIPCLAQYAAEKGFSIYLLGAGPGIAATAAEVLTERYPNLIIAGVHSPPYRSVLEMDASLIEQINETAPDILLVAFGNPKQEKWIGMYREKLQVPVMIGVGGSLDFVAGNKKRAPEWMQHSGLEWLYRLAQEPQRLWRRYVVDLIGFGSFFFWQLWWMRRGNRPKTLFPTADLMVVENEAIITLNGRLTVENVDWLLTAGQQGLDESPMVIARMEKVTFIDSSAIGTLIELTRQARAKGGEFRLIGLRPEVLQVITIMRLDGFFAIEPGTSGPKERENGAGLFPIKEISGEITEADDQWIVLKIPRTLDARTAPAVLQEAIDLLNNKPFLIADFSETRFLTSAGLAVLAQLDKEACAMDGQFRVAGCNQDVLRVIQMTRFDKFLALFESVPAALNNSTSH